MDLGLPWIVDGVDLQTLPWLVDGIDLQTLQLILGGTMDRPYNGQTVDPWTDHMTDVLSVDRNDTDPTVH